MENSIKSVWKEFVNISMLLRDVTNKIRLLEDPKDISEMNRLTVAQAKVANFIFEHNNEAIMLKDIAKSVKVTSGAASQMVDYLVKKGLVVRTQNDQDRRAVIITISDKGRDLIKSAQARYNDITDEIFADISKEDEEAFVRVLKHTYSKLIEKSKALDAE